MKFLFTALLLLLPLALAAQPLKSVIVTYPKDTPDDVVDRAKELVRSQGGVIVHDYNVLFKGFAAETPETAIQTLSTESTDYKPTIEEDSSVGIDEDKHPL
ncbi:hypothetical protein N7492_009300 [Penicillium capsulatum]|uniref:Proteinase inhibitor, propeptide n=1 Tax=Penicillium capsulatum TaxID=69766 RepID=A0A9W9HSN9_9EURO|nr:hypothetical protein N7492_009300 [Penicillium capsulatum]KAJ6106694.1 hypothetical protein N7512_010211 [Penicillium capsulatum]